MDFIESRPLHGYPGGTRGLARALGELLRHLQAAPVFPHFVDYTDIVGRLFAHVRRTGLFAPGMLDIHVEHLERIRQSYHSGVERLVSTMHIPAISCLMVGAFGSLIGNLPTAMTLWSIWQR